MTKDERLYRKASEALQAVHLPAYYRYCATLAMIEHVDDASVANALIEAAGERYDEAIRSAERAYDTAMPQIRLWVQVRPVCAVSG